jgi:cytochrome c oxidase subunit 4
MDTEKGTNQQEEKHRPNYVGVFAALTILTAAEVGVTYLPIPRVPVLIPLALLKALLVALFYMHLKFDRRLFAAIFGMGLLVGLGLLLSLIALFNPAAMQNP